jgi:hypothetical protein
MTGIGGGAHYEGQRAPVFGREHFEMPPEVRYGVIDFRGKGIGGYGEGRQRQQWQGTGSGEGGAAGDGIRHDLHPSIEFRLVASMVDAGPSRMRFPFNNRVLL